MTLSDLLQGCSDKSDTVMINKNVTRVLILIKILHSKLMLKNCVKNYQNVLDFYVESARI
jgi:hypothetical protein